MNVIFKLLTGPAAFAGRVRRSQACSEGPKQSRHRTSCGGQKPKLTPGQARIAQAMCSGTGSEGKRRYTVAQIAAEFGVTRPTIYRHLQCLTPA